MNKFLAGLTALFLTISSASAQVIPIGGGGSSIAQTTGTWTPVFTSSGGGGSPVYVSQSGNYTKTGSTVIATFFVRSSALTGLSGSLQVGGLPFTSANTTESPGSCSTGQFQGLTFGASATQLILQVQSNSTVIEVNNGGSGIVYTNQQVTNSAAASQIQATCTYRTP
jgi:hypothetical protein